VSIGVAQDEAQTGTWSPKVVRIALLASLAVNLLGIGVIGGSWLGPQHSGSKEFGLKGFSYTMSNERGQMVRDAFGPYRPVIRDIRDAADNARADAANALAGEPFDPAKLRAAIDRLNDAETKGRERVSAFFLEVSGKFTAEERVAFAQWWRQHKMRGGRQASSSAGAGATP
jgi:uncharacterized membrane protein